MNTKSVQVVMSTYNGEKYLKEQIDSILSQEGVDVRLYIRDDGSSDRTTDILASYEENGRCEAAEVAALCLANLYNSGGHRKITPDEYETIKKYLQKFPESMHIRAAFIIASEAIYSPSAEYKRVPDKIINKAKQWSEQYPKKIEFQEAYFGLLFSRLKYAQAQDMRNEQRRVYREMKTVAERANYSEYNESNQLMESVDILHRVFGY